MAEAVVVGVRVRPFNAREEKLNATVCIDMNGPTTSIRDDNDKPTHFTFDESFWSHDGFDTTETGYSVAKPGSIYADQKYVFDTFGKRVLDNAWDGFHCCLFAYGQTGAGKSYSMVGYGANKGIVPISCEEIFRRIEANDQPDKRYEVTVSMIEIYNEAVQDLLIMPEDRPKKGLEIRESKLLGIYIDGVLKRPVMNYPEIEATIEEATNHRTVGSTLMNATSSRAHTVQIIEFKQVLNVAGKDQVKVSMINLVDLAGSEKAGQTGASGDRLKEGAAINKSLSALGNVIEKLAEKSSGKGKNVIIPYRDSKLTRLLQNALGGSSKTIMICALSPASSNYEETLSTLRYADRAKKIKNNATVNENPQDKLMRELREENERLKTMCGAGGGVAASSEQLAEVEAKRKEIAEVEAALAEMQKSFEQRVQEAKNQQLEQQERKRRTTIGLVKAHVQCPQLVNLNEDPQLTGRIKYSLEDGKVTRIGGRKEDSSTSNSDDEDDDEKDSDEDEGDEPEILLLNESIFEKHAEIVNVGGECYIWAEATRAHATFVNGISLAVLLRQQKDSSKENTPRQQKDSSKENSPRKPEVDDSQVSGVSAASAGKDPEQEGTKEEKDQKKNHNRDDGSDEGSESGSDSDKGSKESKESKGDKTEEKPKKELQARGIRLNNGDRVVFAKCFFFFAAPNDITPEIMILTGQVDFNKATKELKANKLRNIGHKFMKPSDGAAGGGGGAKGFFGPGLLGRLKGLQAAEQAGEANDGAGNDGADDDDDDFVRPARPMRTKTGSLNSTLQRIDSVNSDTSQSSGEMASEIHALREELAMKNELLAQKDAEIQQLKSMLEKVAPGLIAHAAETTLHPSQLENGGIRGTNEITGSPFTLTPMSFMSPGSQDVASWSDKMLATFSITPASEAMTPGQAITPGTPAAIKSGKSAARMRDALEAIQKVEASLLNLTNKNSKKHHGEPPVSRKSCVSLKSCVSFHETVGNS